MSSVQFFSGELLGVFCFGCENFEQGSLGTLVGQGAERRREVEFVGL